MDKINIQIKDKKIFITTKQKLSHIITNELCGHIVIDKEDDFFIYNIPLLPYNTFILYRIVGSKPTIFDNQKEILEELKEHSVNIPVPKAFLIDDKKIGINLPSINSYNRLLNVIGAKHYKLTTHYVTIGRVYDVIEYIKRFKHPFLPNIQIREDLQEFLNTPFSERNEMEDLFHTPTTELNSIKNGYKVKTEGLVKLKYNSAVDILLRRPVYYIDRTETFTKRSARYGKSSYFKGEITDLSVSFNSSLILTIKDSNLDLINFIFFKQGWMVTKFKVGDTVVVSGIKTPEKTYTGNEIFTQEELEVLPIAPVYRQSPTNGIKSNILINSVREMFYRFNGKDLAKYVTSQEKSLWENLYNLHFPKNSKEYAETLDNLAYFELLYLQLIFHNRKMTEKKDLGVKKQLKTPTLMNNALNGLPYQLTKGQNKAIESVIQRLNSNYAENILLSGDVGTGKTTVAQAACLYTVEAGYQAVLVGPTEILAQQLYNTFLKLLEPLEIRPTIAYLSGNTSSKEKKEILSKVEKGEIQILVGTHGVFNIKYKNLGLVVIDEQQKFGTNQRNALLNAREDNRKPDILAQTATPIPRSTALAFYGDIDLITLNEKPGNRRENITNWIQQSSDDFLDDTDNPTWKHIFKEIEEGHQVFIVTPAVEEGANSASVKKTETILKKKFKDITIETVHGRINKDKQNKVIDKFRKGEIQILIASSIIEVGVDIPNSTIMLVLDADRFGASSLHQIRGRVGRNHLQGYCYLISDKTDNKNAERRLSSLVESNDGFQIALVDLETRKEGDLFGTQQSGESNLIFCNLVDHSSLIEQAKSEAIRIYNSEYKDLAMRDALAFLKKEEVEGA